MARKQVVVRFEEELIDRIKAQLGDRTLQWWLERACEGALNWPKALLPDLAGPPERVGASRAVPAKAPSTAVKGFAGSTMQPNRDVPELGWYRPSSQEAKRGVELNLDLLKQAGARRGA